MGRYSNRVSLYAYIFISIFYLRANTKNEDILRIYLRLIEVL